MKDLIEEKVLYNVLQQADRKEPLSAAPDQEYLKSLKTLNIIQEGWEGGLTDFGRNLFNWLQNKLIKWS